MVCAVPDALAFLASLLWLAIAYHNQTYVYLPLLRDLKRAEDEFREFNLYLEHTPEEAEKDFEDHLKERMIDASDRNTESNDLRAKHLYWARVTLFVVLVLTALAGFPYVIDQVRK